MPSLFNKSMDLKLLSLVRENPSLYDNEHPKYLDYNSREVVWQKIGDALSRPGPLCKTRWVNIRDMMRRKLRLRKRNPTLSANKYRYRYEDELDFILPYFKDTNNSANEDLVKYLENEETEFVSTDYIESEEQEEPIEQKVEIKRQDEVNESVISSDLNPTDPLNVFLITIGTTLRNFTPYYLNKAKSKIFQIVQDFELQQIVDRDSQAGSSDGTS